MGTTKIDTSNMDPRVAKALEVVQRNILMAVSYTHLTLPTNREV